MRRTATLGMESIDMRYFKKAASKFTRSKKFRDISTIIEYFYPYLILKVQNVYNWGRLPLIKPYFDPYGSLIEMITTEIPPNTTYRDIMKQT